MSFVYAVMLAAATVTALAAEPSLRVRLSQAPLPGAQPAAVAAPTSRHFVSSHKGKFGGVSLSYTATAEDTVLPDSHGAPAALLFSFSYIRDGVKDTNARPVTFVFNGGPGSSSVWMHLGLFGPKRVAFENVVQPPTAPPFALSDNPNTPLDVTDIVLIDPIGTGFSKLLPGGKAEEFYGVSEDARATVDFIRAWLTTHHRWNSPRYIVGESYGTVRAAEIAKTLVGGPTTGAIPGITLSGIALMGLAMGDPGFDVSPQTLLPSLAATAWYHGKVDKQGRTLDAFITEVRQFTAQEYGPALYLGARLPVDRRSAIAKRLSQLTGLSEQFILEHDLRIGSGAFATELLRDTQTQVGAYDSRYTLPRKSSGGDPVTDDPAMGQYVPAFIGAFQEFLRNDLKVTLDDQYEAIAFGSVNARWNWGGSRSGSNNLAEDIGVAMRRNPSLRLFVASGYYDLVTPFGTAEYMIDHAGIPLERTTIRTYESGHMAYLGDAPAQRFAADLRAFIRSDARRPQENHSP